jgi:hypothetical protein
MGSACFVDLIDRANLLLKYAISTECNRGCMQDHHFDQSAVLST